MNEMGQMDGVSTVFIHDAGGFESRPECLTYGDKRTDSGGDERKREGRRGGGP